MKIEEYLKENFGDVSHLKPVDISQDVLARLPKYGLGPFTDPLIRNIAIGLSAVLIIASSWLRFNQAPLYPLDADSLLIEKGGMAQIYKNGEWQSADINSRIPKDSVLKTNENGFIRFGLPDQSNLLLRENSILEIRSPFPRVEFNLIKGGLLIFAEKSPLRKTFSIFAGQIEIRVVGTRFNVSKGEDIIQIEVLEGALELRDYVKDEKIAVLGQLEKARLEKGNPASLSIERLSLKEIDDLKEGLGLSGRGEPAPEEIRGRFWWRELRSDER